MSPEDVAEYRATHGLSLAALGSILGVSGTAVGNWEKGRGVALESTQEKILRLLGCPPPREADRGPSLRLLDGSRGGVTLEAVGRIVVAYVQATRVEAEDLPALVRRVRSTLA